MVLIVILCSITTSLPCFLPKGILTSIHGMLNPSVKVAICPESGAESDAILARWSGCGDKAHAPRRRSLVARCLLRTVLEEVTGTGGSEWAFTTNSKGKPFAIHPSGIAAPEISISHSGSVVAAAATTMGQLGVDVEQHRCDRSFAEIAEYAFGPEEAGEAAVSQRDFYRIWTLREAMAKATGKGLAMAADGRDRVHGVPVSGCWEREIEGAFWRAAHFEPVTGYSLAIAVKVEHSARQHHWSDEAVEWLPRDRNQFRGME